LALPQAQHINHQNSPCVNCGQCTQYHTKDEEKERKEMNNEVIFVKEEKCDVPEMLNNMKEEEFIASRDVDERVFHQHVNMYSPISVTDTLHEEKRELNFYEIQDQFFGNLMKAHFDDIGEVVEYLKEDMSLM
jgi:hypothetical protein